MPLRVTSAANADLIQAHDWYERQSRGLGKEFIRAIDATLAFIERHPVLLTPVHGGVRRAFAKRFPYSVYYVCDAPDSQRVIAILHTAMDVARLDKRLE